MATFSRRVLLRLFGWGGAPDPGTEELRAPGAHPRATPASAPADAPEHPPDPPHPGLFIGLDYGAAYSKLALRDGLGGVALPVPSPDFPRETGPGDPFGRPLPLSEDVCPSRLALGGDRLHFGWDGHGRIQSGGARPLMSRKGRILPLDVRQESGPAPCALDLRLGPLGVAHLELLYQVWRGAAFARDWAETSGRGSLAEGRWALGLRGWDGGDIGGMLEAAVAFVEAGACPDLSGGIGLMEAEGIVKELRAWREARSEGAPSRGMIFPGALADLPTFARADRLPSGLYCALSVGAAYSSARFFALERPGGRMDRPGRIDALSYAHHHEGSDRLTLSLADAQGLEDFGALRGNEGPAFVGQRAQCAIDRDLCLHHLKGLYLQAFRDALRHGDHTSALWEGDYGLILYGGGSWLRPLREPILTRAHPDVRRDPSLVEPGKPYDLRASDGGPHRGDAYFLHEAYGAATTALALATRPDALPTST